MQWEIAPDGSASAVGEEAREVGPRRPGSAAISPRRLYRRIATCTENVSANVSWRSPILRAQGFDATLRSFPNPPARKSFRFARSAPDRAARAVVLKERTCRFPCATTSMRLSAPRLRAAQSLCSHACTRSWLEPGPPGSAWARYVEPLVRIRWPDKARGWPHHQFDSSRSAIVGPPRAFDRSRPAVPAPQRLRRAAELRRDLTDRHPL